LIADLLPEVSTAAQPYWDALRRGELLLQRCGCGHVQHYPRRRCTRCLSAQLGWVRSTGTGTVAASTTVHRAPLAELRPLVPYVIALIDLDEGVRVMANVVDCDPGSVVPRLRVVARFVELAPDLAIAAFAPASNEEDS
jgi:uncharacterized OB-fold protein